MRERITFVHLPDDAFDPKQLRLDNDTLYVSSLKASREDRLTFGLYELPQELWRVLKQSHEIHVRWTCSKPYLSIAPFVSRTPPGLQVFFTPQRNRSADLLCPLLLKTFGADLKCSLPEETFTSLSVISDRFTSSAALQYYSLLPSLKDFITYIQLKICSSSDETCLAKASSLSSVDYLDLDYDAISQSLILTTLRHKSSPPGTWDTQLRISAGSAKTEIGVLASEKATEPEELSFGGFLTVLGESTKLTPTRFSFPSRHHVPPATSGTTYHATFPGPTGLHPILRLTFPTSALQPPLAACALHTYLVLPSPFFPDKYQLSTPLLLASKNLRAMHSLSGETDLEAPDWVVAKWGSAMLLELAPPPLIAASAVGKKPPSVANSTPWHASIPLHLRYLPPSPNGTSLISVPWPPVFWACPTDDGTKMATSPFDRVNVGYESLFGPRTMFFHLQPDVAAASSAGRDGALVESLRVPVLQAGWEGWIVWGTVTAVVLGFSWVVGKLVQGLGEKGREKERGKGVKRE